MNIKRLKEFDLGVVAKQVRSISVNMRNGKQAILFVYSAEECIDSGEKLYHHPKDTLKLALYCCLI